MHPTILFCFCRQMPALDPTDCPIPQLIVGLGNPEPRYDHTRHNIGFEFVDELAKVWGISFSKNQRFNGLYGEGRSPFGKIRLLKPLTYMNRSGQSIRAVVDWYKLEPEAVLVIYDDMDLPLGRLRLRASGSAGGHNGIKSTIAHLNTKNFPRLRLGIGKPRQQKGETVSHVLGRFAPDEQGTVQKVMKLGLDATEMALKSGIAKSMSLYNNKNVGPQPLKPDPKLKENPQSTKPDTSESGSKPEPAGTSS